MSGKAIGKTMLFGFPGTYARSGDCIIAQKPVRDNSSDLPFGHAAQIHTDGSIQKADSNFTAAIFAGVAVREVKQSVDYYNSNGAYKKNEPADIIQRGSVSVLCNVGTPAPAGKVYIRVLENAAIPAGLVGGFEAEADGDNTVELTNCRWNSVGKDANGVAELVILTRVNP